MLHAAQWPGERGRQLVEALSQHVETVETIPAPRLSRPGRSPVKGWVKDYLPSSWRRPAIGLRLVVRGVTNTVRWSWRIWRRRRAAPPDVIVARYFEYELTPLIIARLLRRPLVLETHSPFAVERALATGRPARLARWIDRRMFTAADIIWVHTPALQQLVAEMIDEPDKVSVIPFGVEDLGLVADPADHRPPIEIVFAGSFYPWHGVEELITAYAQLADQVPHTRLTLIGDGLTRPDGERLARELDVDVAFPGWMEREALFEHLANSHIGVAPYHELPANYFEPVKILDFHMAGLPVVASSVGEIPRRVVEGETGLLVPPGDVGALTAALSKLATDPELRGAMGRAARLRARSIGETARAVAGLCRALVPGR